MNPTKLTDLTQLRDPTLAIEAKIVGLAAGDREIKTDADRREMLEQSLQGKHVELTVTAVTSIEPDKPKPLPASMAELANANFSRFGKTGLQAFVRSFKGRPFLRDHDRALVARGGRIKASRPEAEDARTLFVQELHVVKPWAVQGILDGTIETFSIGWQPKGNTFEDWRNALRCTVCSESILSWECPHYPGMVTELAEGGEEVIVEAEWDSRRIRGREVSAVTFPAVDGTYIDDFAIALAELKQGSHQHHKELTMHKILSALGVEDEKAGLAAIKELQKAAESAAQETAAALATAKKDAKDARAELEAATKAKDDAELALAAEKETHGQTRAALEQAQAKLDESEKTQRKAEVDALIESAMSEGKMRPGAPGEDGKPTQGAVERYVRKLAADDIAAARAHVADMPKIDPIGRKLETPTEVERTEANDFGLTEQQKKYADQLGLSYEEYARGGSPKKDPKKAA